MMRLEAPGLARDIREATVLADVLPFFNDSEAAEAFVRAGIEPHASAYPGPVRYVDLGGGDGFLARHVACLLQERYGDVAATVVDGNPRALLQAQRAGLRVRPVAIETLDAPATSLFTMRLVNHYNGQRRLRAMLGRTYANLLPGGDLVSQIETGTRRLCVFRSILARRLDRFAADRHGRGGETCRWVTHERYAGMLEETGFAMVDVLPRFMVFDMPLDALLRLGFERFHADGTLEDAQRAAFLEQGVRLALDMLGPDDGLHEGDDGELTLRSTHALLVARKPTVVPDVKAE